LENVNHRTEDGCRSRQYRQTEEVLKAQRKAIRRRCYLKHQQARIDYTRKYREDHPEETKAYAKQYAKDHPEAQRKRVRKHCSKKQREKEAAAREAEIQAIMAKGYSREDAEFVLEIRA
jgi:hypothetical protein